MVRVRIEVRVGVGVGVRLGLGSGLRHVLRHDALSTSVSNNLVHVRRIGIRRNGAEPSLRKSDIQSFLSETASCCSPVAG